MLPFPLRQILYVKEMDVVEDKKFYRSAGVTPDHVPVAKPRRTRPQSLASDSVAASGEQ